MRTPLAWFNKYLPVWLALFLISGCQTPEERDKGKEASTLRLYLEETFDPTGAKTELVPIYRADPIPVRIQKGPFLDEGSLVDAAITETMGGYAIQVEFDFHGSLVLENVSTAYRGRRIVVYCMFSEGRWLAAPMITETFGEGVFTFTPDASREEAERIVRGLRNVAVKLGHKAKPRASKPEKIDQKGESAAEASQDQSQ